MVWNAETLPNLKFVKKNQHAIANVYFWVWSDFWTPFDFDLVAVENSEWNFYIIAYFV